MTLLKAAYVDRRMTNTSPADDLLDLSPGRRPGRPSHATTCPAWWPQPLARERLLRQQQPGLLEGPAAPTSHTSTDTAAPAGEVIVRFDRTAHRDEEPLGRVS